MVMRVEQNINSINALAGVFNGAANNRVIKFNVDKKIVMTGCQGTHVSVSKIFSGKQETVAKAMYDYLSSKTLGNYIGMLLGNNFYPLGASDQNSSYFRDGFERVYDFNIPFFNLLGDHDWGFHSNRSYGDDQNFNKRAAAQVLRTFNANNRAIAHQQNEINGNYELKHWNMPARYYCLEFPGAVFFVIDSNTYAFDDDQQTWLNSLYQQYSRDNRKKVLVSHHPFFSYGKRSTPQGKVGDVRKYRLNEYNVLSVSLHTSNSMSEWLYATIVNKQRLRFDVLLSAHDHLLAVSEHAINGHEMTQIIMGGGGVPLEKVKTNPSNGQAMSAYGFMEFNTADLSYKIMRVIPKVMPGSFRTEVWSPSFEYQINPLYEPCPSSRRNAIAPVDENTGELSRRPPQGRPASVIYETVMGDEEGASSRCFPQVREAFVHTPTESPYEVMGSEADEVVVMHDDVEAIMMTAVREFEDSAASLYAKVIPRGERLAAPTPTLPPKSKQFLPTYDES